MYCFYFFISTKLEIWRKAQCESARRPKSDWGGKIWGLWNSPSGKVTWPKLKCISIRRTCNVDIGWVNMHTYKFFVSGPKFTNFLCLTRDELLFITPLTDCQYLHAFQRYSQSNTKVILNRTEFWTFFCPPKLLVGSIPQKLYPH